MSTTTTRVVVLRETDSFLYVIAEDGPTYLNRTTDGQSVLRSKQIRINKKHIYPGSSNLGFADKNKNDMKVARGTLVLPTWVARQYGIWKKSEEVRLHNLQLAEKKKA